MFEEIFEPDPLEEQALIESLGGDGPEPLPPAPTPVILSQLMKAVRARRAQDELQQLAAQRERQAMQQARRQAPAPPAMPAMAPVASHEAPPALPLMPPVASHGPVKPAHPHQRVANILTAPYSALSGAMTALIDQPPDAGMRQRTQAALTGAGQALGKSLDQPTDVFDELAKRGVDLPTPVRLFGQLGLDPSNYLGGDPTDIAKAGVGAAALVPKVIAALPETTAAAKAALKAVPEGIGAMTEAAGSAYQGAKLLKRLDKETAQAFMAATENYPRVRHAARFMHPAEVARLTKEDAVRQFDRFYDVLPDVKTLVGGIHGGAAKRGWYEHSRNAIEAVHGKDADIFAGVLAATSPQTSVEANFVNAHNIFADWKAAGRPTDPAQIEALMRDTIKRTTKKGEGEALDAWVNNTVRVLQDHKTLSGPKVDSFWTNLRARARQTPYGPMNPDQATTLDAWMANVFGVHNETFAGSATPKQVAEGNPGFTPEYIAGSARLREAAKTLGLSPAEAQETLWSFGKALYEQAEETGMSARQIIEQGLLDPARVAGTPDFSVLYRKMGIDVPQPTVAKWAPEITSNKQMLRIADTLDALMESRGMATRYKTARGDPETVMTNLMLEGRPGAGLASAGTDFPTEVSAKKLAEARKKGSKKTEAEMLQSAQDYWSNARLSPMVNPRGENVLAAALFPGNTAPVSRGRGHWLDPSTGVLESNRVQTVPVRLKTTAGGAAIQPSEEHAVRFLRDLMGAFTRQKVVPVTAMQPGLEGGAENVMRLWPSVKAESFPPEVMRQVGQSLSPDDFALQHSTEGLNVLKFAGGITPQEQQTIDSLARQLMHQQKPRSTRMTPQKVMGSKTGTNIAQPQTQYVEAQWGPQGLPGGSRQITGPLMTDYTQLSSARKKALDARPVRDAAADQLRLLERNPNAPEDQKNFFRIIASEGVSGLAKALGDPTQVLPVLFMLGLDGAATLAMREGSQPSAEPQ